MHDSMTWSMRLRSRGHRSEYAVRLLWGKRRATHPLPYCCETGGVSAGEMEGEGGTSCLTGKY